MHVTIELNKRVAIMRERYSFLHDYSTDTLNKLHLNMMQKAKESDNNIDEFAIPLALIELELNRRQNLTNHLDGLRHNVMSIFDKFIL